MKIFRLFACSVMLNMVMLVNAAAANAQTGGALSGGTFSPKDIVKAIDGLTSAPSSPTMRTIADVASWGTAITAVALDTKASWTAPDRRRAFTKQGLGLAITYGAVFLVKQGVKRARPCAPACGMDNPNYSFYSAHTAVAAASGQPVLTGLTAAGRVLGAKHYLTDVLVGLAQGWVVRKVLR